MKQEVYLCEQKDEVFIKVETAENIQNLIEREKDENRSEFERYLHRNDPPGFHEFKARKIDPDKDRIKEPLGISFIKMENVDVEYLDDKIKYLNINKINIRDGKLDIPLPQRITDNVETFFCGGKVKGVIDLDLYKNLEEINLLDWNAKIIFKNDTGNNKVKKMIVWYHKPKDKSLKTLVEYLPNLEYLEIIHTNIESLEGIENLSKLKYLRISYGRNLKKIYYTNECKEMNAIHFENCNKIEDFDELIKHPNSSIIKTKW